jgi:2-polyprenyl-3-methyl-5-hydroxy-6-metoxy-1,4-benzoquinol methylase
MKLLAKLKMIVPKGLKDWVHKNVIFGEKYCLNSIGLALKEQGLLAINNKLIEAVPDITNQYSSFSVTGEYLNAKVRGLHAFQVFLVNQALELLSGELGKTVTIVDIGDSAGTHVQYFKELNKNKDLRCLSVNLDRQAIDRIRSKGLEAVEARAENLASLSIKADIFVSFEMLEHLMDPCNFLKSLAENSDCKAFVITVPYVKHSRVGFNYIRHNLTGGINAENTHIFELSPHDYNLLFKHSGWKIIYEKIYFQYPQRLLFRWLAKKHWQKHDYEGFYGVILRRDDTWSQLYDSWDKNKGAK